MNVPDRRKPGRPPKKQIEEDAAETQHATARRLIEAATIEFSNAGFSGARIDRISSRANANRQLVYYHFGSKEALYEAVLTQAYLQYCDTPAALLQEIHNLAPRAAMRRLIENLFRRSAAMARLQRLLHHASLFATKNPKRLTEVRVAYAQLIGIIHEVLEKGAADGSFRRDIDAKEFYISVIGNMGMRVSSAATRKR